MIYITKGIGLDDQVDLSTFFFFFFLQGYADILVPDLDKRMFYSVMKLNTLKLMR